MKRRQSVIEVKILIDPIYGWGHKPEDHVELLQHQLDTMIPWYKPEVSLIRVDKVES